MISGPEEGGFTVRLPDVPAYGEGETEEEAIEDLREAIRGYIEVFGLDDALHQGNRSYRAGIIDPNRPIGRSDQTA